jgi:hypothetical protein
MQNGDVFLSVRPFGCTAPQGSWVLSGNVFALGGRAAGHIAGITTYAQVLAANGDWFQLETGCPGAPLVSFQGNAFEMAGRSASPGEEFTTFGGGACVGVEYGVTTVGNVFRWMGGGGCSVWMYAGALPIGPTPVQSASWGRLKLRYR